MDKLVNDYSEDLTIVGKEQRRRGRPPTGENTKVIRVPKDFNREKAIIMYYDWLPIIQEYRSIAKENPLAVRNEKLIKLIEELGEL